MQVAGDSTSAGAEEGERWGCHVDGSNTRLRTNPQHYRDSGLIERFGHLTKYLRHRCKASVEEVQPHRAAAVSAAARVTKCSARENIARKTQDARAGIEEVVTGRRGWGGGLHAVVDDGERDVLESKYFLSVVIRDESAVHLSDAKLK
jgi:hypothetical protein